MTDPTEATRRVMVAIDALTPTPRELLENEYGQVWDTDQMQEDFTVSGFMAPYVGVTRKSDGAKGLIRFQARPRFYFDFRAA